MVLPYPGPPSEMLHLWVTMNEGEDYEELFFQGTGLFQPGVRGRYLGHILVEALRDDSRLLGFLFPGLDKKIVRDRKNLEFMLEYSFPSMGKKRKQRYADFAVFHKGRVVGLMEIKCEDDFHDSQLEDYVEYVQMISEGVDVCLTVLSQYDIFSEYRQRLECVGGCGHCVKYSDLHGFLEKNSDSSAVYRMFKEYLEETYIDIEEEYSDDALLLLAVKGLNLRHDHGFGRKASHDNINALPHVWAKQIRIITVLKDRFYADNRECFNTRPHISFKFDPWFKLKPLARKVKEMQDAGESEVCLSPKLRSGGNFGVWAQCKLKTVSKWLYINWGLDYCVQLEDKSSETEREFFTELFVEVHGQGGLYQSKESGIEPPLEEGACYDKIREIASKCICDLLPEVKEREHVEALKSLSKSLERE